MCSFVQICMLHIHVVAYSVALFDAGECTARDRGQPVKPCIPGAWPVAICRSPGYTCQAASEDQQLFKCQPSPLGAPAPTSASFWPSTAPAPPPASGSSSSSLAGPPPSGPAPHAPGPQQRQGVSEATSVVASGGRRLLLAAQHRR